MEFLIGIFLIFATLAILNELSSLKKETQKNNILLHKIATQVGVSGVSIDEEIRMLLTVKGKRQTIKRLQEFSGMDSIEAKTYVDKLEKEMVKRLNV